MEEEPRTLSKAGDYDGTCPCSDPRCDWSRKARAGTLAQVRTRMDELYREGLSGMFRFYELFNVGAEFGPDKPEPRITFAECENGRISILEDGKVDHTISQRSFDAIKQLGAEEAEDE